jgi:hypothetical protein
LILMQFHPSPFSQIFSCNLFLFYLFCNPSDCFPRGFPTKIHFLSPPTLRTTITPLALKTLLFLRS